VANNSWVEYRSSGTICVFVHGVQSSARDCWFNAKTGKFWPHLLQQDRVFGGVSIFLGGYFTQLDAGEYGMRDCAKELLEGLARSYSGSPAVLEHERLVFVCHSLGGIVTLYMLECWRDLFQSKSILLVLIASPSIGSQWANSLEAVITLFGNRTGRELRWKSNSLDDLDRRFKDMRDRRLIPRLTGCELCEQNFIKTPGFFRVRPIVNVDSAARYFGDHHLIPGSDHMSIVKPATAEERVHLLLRDFYRKFDEDYPAVQPVPARPVALGDASGVTPDLFQCERISLAIRIYDDGDGHNQMTYEGIRAVRSAEGASYHLHNQEVTAGRATDYVLLSEGSSAGISLDEERKRARFETPPSPERRQRLTIESLDAHSYCMDRGELSAFGNPPLGADSDYTDFAVRWEKVDQLVMQVSFPDSMSLASEPPFVQAYQVFDTNAQRRQVFDSALTVAASEGFSYSLLLRTAVLSVKNPPQNSSYRILWRLGSPVNSVAPATLNQLALLEVRRRALFSVRECFASGVEAGPMMAHRKKGVVAALVALSKDVASRLERAVAKTPADKVALRELLPYLEITLMAVAPSGPKVLRFVAGESVELTALWEAKITMGEGIAGRAARLLDARTYDDEEVAGTVSAGVYLELEKGKRHSWLLAIPLWSEECGRAAIGVLNIGTFDAGCARILRSLGQVEQVRSLAAWANAEFLPTLLAVVSSDQEHKTS